LQELKPKGLGRKARDHSWCFAILSEWPSDRDDSQWYHAFLFRSEDRSTFGLKEWLGVGWPHQQEFREMATKVVTDKTFRDSLISDDPDLPRVWKRS
jgi:hypothetical protein